MLPKTLRMATTYIVVDAIFNDALLITGNFWFNYPIMKPSTEATENKKSP